jgi:hypothetical protein
MARFTDEGRGVWQRHREAQRNGANRRPAAAGAAPARGTSVLSDGLWRCMATGRELNRHGN